MVYVAQAVLLCIVLCSIASTQAGYDYSYLIDDCNGDPDQWVIYLGEDGASTYGVVQLMRSGEYGFNYNCSLTLVSPASYSLNIVVNWVDIYYDTTCSLDYLEINNDAFEERYCGRDTSDKVLTMDNYTVVRFVSDAILHWDRDDYNGFHLYYNVFHTDNCSSTGEYECGLGNKCILRELTCDNKNNCGDYTDEQYCPTSDGTRTPVFLIVLWTWIVVVIIVIIVVSYYSGKCCCCKKCKRTTTHSVYPQVSAVNITTTSEEQITMSQLSSSLSYSPPPPYAEAAAATDILDTKCNEKTTI